MSHDLNRVSNDTLSSIGDTLDAGLRVAFGQSEGTSRISVLEQLSDRLGDRERILLRQDPDVSIPMVRPLNHVGDGPGDSRSRYQIVGEIAQGGIGVVLLGRDVDLGRDVAMKVLRPDHCDRPAMIRRFVEEAQIAGQLQHPGILPVYELGLGEEGRPYFTMKLVRGQTLSGQLAQRPDVDHDRQRFLRIFAQVCETMAYAHAKGVIHRDLKPSNIMVGAFGEVQVVDWGLAKVLTRDREANGTCLPDYSRSGHQIATVRTESDGAESLVGSVMGTPAYMCPEQARGETDRLDERADVFALGAILCELLSGSPPYPPGAADAIALAGRADLRAAHERLDGCAADEDVVALARRCLSPAKEARPRNAGTVAAEMNKYLESLERRAHESALAAAEAGARVAGERRARRLTLALALTFIIGLGLMGGGWAWVAGKDHEREKLATQRLNEVLDSAAVLLGEAKAARIGDQTRWARALTAGEHVGTLLHSGQVDVGAARRASEFLAQLKKADTDRRTIDRIEEAVTVGATHEDLESWLWMEQALRTAFREYGIDVDTLSKEQVAERIRASDMAARLADGLELWIGTNFHLGDFGERRFTIPQLLEWVNVLYAADPDPFRTELRKLIYTGRPEIEKLRALSATCNYATTPPRTLSWLATAFAMGGDSEGGIETFRKAVMLHPDDFMLNFDFAYQLMPAGRHREAVPYLHRCIAIRPNVGGVWRKLGVALREAGEPAEAIGALRESIRLQPGHAATFVDLGRSQKANGDAEGAIASFREAVRLKPNQAAGHGYLGQALLESGRLEEARIELKRCQELAAGDSSWKEPSAEWLKRCETMIQRQAGQPSK